MMVKRWTLGMDFQGGSPEAEADDGTVFYPRQTKFVLADDYEKLEADLADVRAMLKDTLAANVRLRSSQITSGADGA